MKFKSTAASILDVFFFFVIMSLPPQNWFFRSVRSVLTGLAPSPSVEMSLSLVQNAFKRLKEKCRVVWVAVRDARDGWVFALATR